MPDYLSRTSLGIEPVDSNGVDWLDASKWVRNPSDELAIRNGCWFDPERAAWACYWMETQLCLYEGAWAGAPIRFLSSANDPTFWDGERNLPWDVPLEWEEALPFYIDRMRRHNQLYHAGEFMHWHGEAVFQVYGWVRRCSDERWKNPQTGEFPIHRRHKRAIIFCAKKNGKSPFTAANALYLTCGDGEGGANVGFAASDLSQAKDIVGKHAFEMVAQSPTLSDTNVCKPNRNECSVTFFPKRSKMFPISAGNARSADARHGLNLSGAIIDEVHVVGKQVYDRINRAFRSREEPVLWEVSTAGDNPESWGKTEFDKAEKIQNGEILLEDHFVAVHAAPQGVSDQDIEKNIKEYIRMANPALGHIVSMEQTLADYHANKHTALDLATFKYEILNIWVNASVCWLPPGLYASNGKWIIEPEDMKARCVIGFDNARRVDLAAAVLSWEYWFDPADIPDAANPGEEFEGDIFDDATQLRRGCLQRPFFWSNEQRIAELSVLNQDVQRWHEDGFIRACRGNQNSEQQIARDLRELIVKYNVSGFVYDPHYCEFIVEYLTEGLQDADGKQIIEPVLSSDQVCPMSQTTNAQAGPVSAFEQDLYKHLIGHEDNPVLSWQFSHANVDYDRYGSMRVVKEQRKSFRTVDGVQAAIMSRYGLLEYDGFSDTRLNYYETNPLEEL